MFLLFSMMFFCSDSNLANQSPILPIVSYALIVGYYKTHTLPIVDAFWLLLDKTLLSVPNTKTSLWKKQDAFSLFLWHYNHRSAHYYRPARPSRLFQLQMLLIFHSGQPDYD